MSEFYPAFTVWLERQTEQINNNTRATASWKRSSLELLALFAYVHYQAKKREKAPEQRWSDTPRDTTVCVIKHTVDNDYMQMASRLISRQPTCSSSHAWTYLFFPVLQHVLELGQLLVLIPFDALGLVTEPAGVILFQSLDGLLLLLFKILHLQVILTLLSLELTAWC